MKNKIAIGAGVVLLGGIGAPGGCEIVAVAALNMVPTTTFTVQNELLFMGGILIQKQMISLKRSLLPIRRSPRLWNVWCRDRLTTTR